MNTTLADVAGSALCAQVDLEIFFPHAGADSREARAICARCSVREECLQVALELGVHGIWGGTSGKQRRDMGGKSPGYWVEEPPCGTEAAERRHYRAGEKPCPICVHGAMLRRATG